MNQFEPECSDISDINVAGIEDAVSKNEASVHAHLMKLKLSLHVSKPHELSNQIDDIIQLLNQPMEK